MDTEKETEREKITQAKNCNHHNTAAVILIFDIPSPLIPLILCIGFLSGVPSRGEPGGRGLSPLAPLAPLAMERGDGGGTGAAG